MRSWLFKNKTVYYGAAFLLLAFVFAIQFADRRNRDGKQERWEWNAMGLGQTLQKGFVNEQPSIATTAAGALPYYAALPTLDMLGLNDYYLPRHPPADFGKGYLGHELGNADYYLQQSPDIFFLFGLGSPLPHFTAETTLFYHSSFKKDYARVHLLYHLEHGLPLPAWQSGIRDSVKLEDSCYMFIKIHSDRIGIRVDHWCPAFAPISPQAGGTNGGFPHSASESLSCLKWRRKAGFKSKARAFAAYALRVSGACSSNSEEAVWQPMSSPKDGGVMAARQ